MTADQLTIIAGFKESVEDFQRAIEGVGPDDVMRMVMATLYFDTLREASHGQSNTILLPYSPDGFSNFMTQTRDAIITGNAATGTRAK